MAIHRKLRLPNRQMASRLLKQVKNRHRTTVLLLVGIIMLISCDNRTVYYQYRTIHPDGWKRTDTLVYEAHITDSATLFRLSLAVRNQDSYPYQNLRLNLAYTTPDSTIVEIDSLVFRLADEEGHWKGRGWSGLYESIFEVGGIKIKRPGTYRFTVTPSNPNPLVVGINDIGLKLTRFRKP